MDGSLDKEQVARCFLRGHETYDSHAMVQKKVSKKLVALLVAHPEILYDRVLEIGCCTGTLTRELFRHHKMGTLFLNDLVPEFHEAVLRRLPAECGKIISPHFGDIESLELPDDLDLVISSSTFQWLSDLQSLFNKIAASLSEDGFFVFSLFGPGTLQEFKKLTGVGLEYRSLVGILEMLDHHFRIDFADTRTDILYFETPREVLRHLQATGVGGVRNRRWTSSGLRKFESDYLDQFGSVEGVPVSFLSSYVVASKKKG